MTFFGHKLSWYSKVKLQYLALKFEHVPISLWRALRLKEVNKALKWPRPSSRLNLFIIVLAYFKIAYQDGDVSIENHSDSFFVIRKKKPYIIWKGFVWCSKQDGLVGNKSTTGELVGIEIHGGIKQGGLVKLVYVPEGGEPRNHRINKTDMKTFCFTSVL